MASPKVTAVVTAYNHERFIEEALQSVLRQSVPLEIVVAPDLGSDATAQVIDAVCRGYSGRHRVVQLPVPHRRLGLAGNYNRAFGAASGEWMMICEGDDVSEPDRSDALLGALTGPSGPPSVFGSLYRVVDAQGRVVEQPVPASLAVPFAESPPDDAGAWDVHGCTLAFPRKTYTHYGPLSPRLATVDGVLVRRALTLSPYRVERHPRPLVSWRVFGANTSGRFTAPAAGQDRLRMFLGSLRDHEIAQMREAREHLRQLEASGAPSNVKQRYLRELARATAFSRLTVNARAGRTPLLCHSVQVLGSPLAGPWARQVLKGAALSLGAP